MWRNSGALIARVRHMRVVQAGCLTGRAAQVDFAEAADGVTVRVTFEAEDTFPVERQRGGWQAILDNFARYVAGQSS
jgi:hypothetical protein